MDIYNMIKIAFASTDGVSVNQHFGWCEEFYIYEIDASGSTFITQSDALEKYEDEAEKLLSKIDALQDSDIVYVSQIGPKASNMVKKAGIYPMSSSNQEQSIQSVIASIQKMLSGNTPLWLKAIVMRKRA